MEESKENSPWDPRDDALVGAPANERCRERGRRAVDDGVGRVPGVREHAARGTSVSASQPLCRREARGGAISPPPLPPSEARRPGKRRPGKSRRAMRPASIAATQKGRNERRRLAPTPCADASTRQDDKKESFFPPCRRRQAEGTGGRDAAEPSPSPPVREKHVRAATAVQEPARPAADNEPRRGSG